MMCSDDKSISELTYKSALSKVQYLCSKEEKCCSDIRKKLQSWHLASEDLNRIIQSLVADKFIDETRYTGFYVRDKFRFNKWGKIKIAYQLKQKQIPEAIVLNALDEISQQEYENRLFEILHKKMKTMREKVPCKLKSKLYRFAKSKGFESDLILKGIEKILHKEL